MATKISVEINTFLTTEEIIRLAKAIQSIVEIHVIPECVKVHVQQVKSRRKVNGKKM